MRKFVFAFILLCGVAGAVLACSRAGNVPQTAIKLYFADAELFRLLPYDAEIPESDAENMARAALDKLIQGRDDNNKIRRLLPEDKRCLSVYVKDSVAYVDLSSRIAHGLPSSRDTERLVIYQITDTLTGIKGIRFVKFTVDGAVRKDFMGYFDMRETYKFRYPE